MKQSYLAMEAVEKKPRFEVYVAGLPPAIDHSSLKAYFRNFGRVNKIYIYTQNAQRPRTAAAKVKLHCKVTVQDESTYLRILSEKNHCFMGRNLFCQEFKKGRELSDHNAHVKNRRVIVKKVPSYFTEDMLLDLIQARLGAVDTIYEFKTDALNLPTVSKRFKSFSVSFRQPEILENIPGTLAISLPDSHHHITIERFEQRLFKESEGGSDRTASDHYLSSQSDLQQRSLELQTRTGLNQPGRGIPGRGIAARSGELGGTADSPGQHRESGLERRAGIISAGLQHSAPTPKERQPNSKLAVQAPSGGPRAARKCTAWFVRPSEHSAANLRFNVLKGPCSHPSQLQQLTY